MNPQVKLGQERSTHLLATYNREPIEWVVNGTPVHWMPLVIFSALPIGFVVRRATYYIGEKVCSELLLTDRTITF